MKGRQAAFIASVCLFSTGHWIGGLVLMLIFVVSGRTEAGL